MSKHRWVLSEDEEYYGIWRFKCRDCGEDETYETYADVNSILDKFYAREERRCETCKHFHSGTYTCKREWAPLKCVLNDFSEWEAKPCAN